MGRLNTKGPLKLNPTVMQDAVMNCLDTRSLAEEVRLRLWRMYRGEEPLPENEAELEALAVSL